MNLTCFLSDTKLRLMQHNLCTRKSANPTFFTEIPIHLNYYPLNTLSLYWQNSTTRNGDE